MPVVSSFTTINGFRVMNAEDADGPGNYYTMRRGFTSGEGVFHIEKANVANLDLESDTNVVVFTCGDTAITLSNLFVDSWWSITGLNTEADKDIVAVRLVDIRSAFRHLNSKKLGTTSANNLSDLAIEIVPTIDVTELNDTGEAAGRYFHYFIGLNRGGSPTWESFITALQNSANTLYVSQGGALYAVANDVAEPAFAAGVNARFTDIYSNPGVNHLYSGHSGNGPLLYPEKVVVQFPRNYQTELGSGVTPVQTDTRILLYSPHPARYNSAGTIINDTELADIARAIRDAYIGGLTASADTPYTRWYSGLVDLQPTGIISEVTFRDLGDGMETLATAAPPPFLRTFTEITGPMWGYAKVNAELIPGGQCMARIWYDVNGTMTKSDPEENIRVNDRLLSTAIAVHTDIAWMYDPIERKFYVIGTQCTASSNADTWGIA